MSRNTLSFNCRVGRSEEEGMEDSSTLVAALVELLRFKDGTSFENWVKMVRLDVHLCPYPQWQRVPLIIRALPQESLLTPPCTIAARRCAKWA